jgi:hypothetical protein
MLHILNGDSMLPAFGKAKISGERCVIADVLHEGPVLADPTDSAFIEARIRFAVEAGWGSPDDATTYNTAWSRCLTSALNHDEVVLWFEHDLYDQLLLLHHIEWFARTQRPAHLSLVCIGSFDGIPDFRGLGQLSAAQLRSLFPGRTELDERSIHVARSAWAAFTSADPRTIETVLAGDTSALPFLDGALRRLLEEYPDTRSGLSRTERQILRAVDGGHRTPVEAFHAQAAMEERVFLGDLLFWGVLRKLADAPQPLLECSVRQLSAGRLPEGAVQLTPFGRVVFSGDADHVAANGIDRWIGGVHLQGTKPQWRWDSSARSIIADA